MIINNKVVQSKFILKSPAYLVYFIMKHFFIELLLNFIVWSHYIMNKKLIGLWFALMTSILIFPAQAQTTGEDTGDFQISITESWITIIMEGETTTSEGETWTTMIETTTTGTEFQQALAWMYANGLTMYNNETDYRPNDGLLREEAAKIIGQAFVVLGYNQTTKNTDCTFSDSAIMDPTLTAHITNTCKRGIFKGTDNGNFLPKEQLTRPQSMALLVRIFEWKFSNESRLPRWGDYYIKWQAMGLTTLNNQVAFDSNITREEMAIYIYRLKNIVSNETLKLMMIGRLSELDSTEQTTTGLLNNFAGLADSLSVNNDPELLEAIRWMNDNELTNFKTIAEYMPFEVLNREQAAKVLTMFAAVFGLNQTSNTSLNCVFQDINNADSSLVTYIENVCQLGIMQGSNWRFLPKENINKSQFVAAIIRLFEGKKLDETTNPRWKNYFEEAQELWMIGPADAVTFDNPITRYEVALFLHRFKVKFQILQNLNSSNIPNQIISTVPWSLITGANNMPEARVYVDMNLLLNKNFSIGYIEIFGERYKIVRTKISENIASADSFERYGDLFTLDSEEKIGTTLFIINSYNLVQGTIRIGATNTYVIDPISNTNAYYKLNQTK